MIMARMTPAEATAVNVPTTYVAGLSEPVPAEVVRSLETLASRGVTVRTLSPAVA